ncbi:MAG: DUF4476 domain-containing protein [Myxococcaceae bacterium]
MRTLTAALLTLAALPAFAGPPHFGAPPPQTAVVVGREDLQRRLVNASQVLSEAIGRVQKKNPDVADALRRTRAELEAMRLQLADAPEANAWQDGHRQDLRTERERERWERERLEHERLERERLERERRPPPPPPPPARPVVYPMQDSALQGLTTAIASESFPRDRLQILEQAAPSSWFLVAQAQQVLALFDFPRDRLAAARLLRPRILDTENFFRLYGSFEFPSDKAELKKILAQ